MTMQRLFETHVPVADLDRSMAFYESILGLELGTRENTRRVAFYWIGGRGTSMLGLWQRPATEISAQHFAIEVSLEGLHSAIARLRTKGIPTENFFNEPTETPTVFGWMPAASIYFKDPDGHSLEYIAMLPGEPRPDLGVVTLNEWQDRFPG